MHGITKNEFLSKINEKIELDSEDRYLIQEASRSIESTTSTSMADLTRAFGANCLQNMVEYLNREYDAYIAMSKVTGTLSNSRVPFVIEDVGFYRASLELIGMKSEFKYVFRFHVMERGEMNNFQEVVNENLVYSSTTPIAKYVSDMVDILENEAIRQ
jgi:hypothetical protein